MCGYVLLVEPEYYTRFPPLGLLKLASYHRAHGDEVRLVRGIRAVGRRPDRIYVTSLYTWAWRPVWEAVRYYRARFPGVEVWLGGIYASLLPDHASLSG
ncbi:MAG: Fe-S oxidoreductase, partial [Nitrososphaeria archaeon]